MSSRTARSDFFLAAQQQLFVLANDSTCLTFPAVTPPCGQAIVRMGLLRYAVAKAEAASLSDV